MAGRYWQVPLVALLLDSGEDGLAVGAAAAEVGFLGHLPLPALVLGKARAALCWVESVMEDGLMVLCAFGQIKVFL